jgi:tRNA pseudouridine55 synthase
MKTPLEDINYAEGSRLLINKPFGITSFGLVFQVKNWLNNKAFREEMLTKGIILTGKKGRIKVGHAGTLDPLASGLMIVCTGKWTKRINEFMGMDKTYTGTFRLGATTPTYDRESTPENVKPTDHIKAGDIEKVKAEFIGEIKQLPPAYSAIKQDGTALYKLAREGKEVKLNPRVMNIRSLELNYDKLPEVAFTVRCSSGTYIRSLANDIGAALGCGAYLTSLVRTEIGDFKLEAAYSLEEMIEHFGTSAKLKVIEAKC